MDGPEPAINRVNSTVHGTASVKHSLEHEHEDEQSSPQMTLLNAATGLFPSPVFVQGLLSLEGRAEVDQQPGDGGAALEGSPVHRGVAAPLTNAEVRPCCMRRGKELFRIM